MKYYIIKDNDIYKLVQMETCKPKRSGKPQGSNFIYNESYEADLLSYQRELKEAKTSAIIFEDQKAAENYFSELIRFPKETPGFENLATDFLTEIPLSDVRIEERKVKFPTLERGWTDIPTQVAILTNKEEKKEEAKSMSVSMEKGEPRVYINNECVTFTKKDLARAFKEGQNSIRVITDAPIYSFTEWYDNFIKSRK